MGHTRTIAQHLENSLKQKGINTQLLEVSENDPKPLLDPLIDGVIVGAPVYVHQYPKKLEDWVRSNRPNLVNRVSAFYSVSLNAADKHPEARKADDELIEQFITETSWVPHFVASIPGALKYLKYGFFKRLLMKRISKKAGGPTDTSRNYEFTDWEAVDQFLESFLLVNDRSNFYIGNRLKTAQSREPSPRLSTLGR